MKQILRFFSFSVLILAALGILVTGGIWLYLDYQKPRIDGRLTCPGLEKEVQIIRDQWGIPHILAQSGKDAYFALGYTLAQDRLFQMELQRRLSKGELAEILGPKLLDVDKKFRTLMLRHRAQEYLAEEDKINQDALGFLDDFLDGVNHFAKTAPLPVEFKLLGVTPEPFTRLDAISIMGYVAYSFADGITRDSLHTMLASRLSQQELAIVFPDFTLDNRETIMEPQGAPRGQEASIEGLSKKSQSNLSSNTFKQKNDFNNFALAFQEIKDTAQKIF
ncbi:MAG: penicillin acylase family protein, partial [Desulfobacterales bacterium]|nr:penicillin acylase family protein [Desulfobacterales bacterium]